MYGSDILLHRLFTKMRQCEKFTCGVLTSMHDGKVFEGRRGEREAR